MMNTKYLGIDVSKRTFNVCVILGEKLKHKKFANTPQGVEQLVGWLSKLEVDEVHACMEASGRYGERLAEDLSDHGYALSMVNPLQIKRFGESHLTRTKTDKKDATLIARFCQINQPRLWQAPTPRQRQLRDWVRRLEALIQMRQQESNRLEGASGEVSAQIQSHLEDLAQQIEQTRRNIRDLIDDDPDMGDRQRELSSIPGIGEATAALILAEIGNVERFTNAKALAAYIGLAPRIRQSGQWQGRTTLSKTGRSQLRKALYLPALVAMKHNPVIKPFAQRLLDKGKPKMSVVGAVMRKLVHIIYGVLKYRTPFNPQHQIEKA